MILLEARNSKYCKSDKQILIRKSQLCVVNRSTSKSNEYEYAYF